MGLFDLAAPVVFAADDALAFLPPLGRLSFWALTTALVGMGLYRLISPQERLKELKRKVVATRKAMASFDGEADEMLPVVMASLKSSLHHLGVTFGAALAASLPVLLIISPVAQRYGHEFPPVGAPVTVSLAPTESEDWAWLPAQAGSPPRWQLQWPDHASPVMLVQAGQSVLQLPLPAPSTVVHKQLWWNWLFANPAGYLSADVPVQAIYVGLPKQQFFGFGPVWMRGWEMSYFTLLILASIAIKMWWRIE